VWAAGFGRHGMPQPASKPDLWPFDLETGVRVLSKAGNLPSKFGHLDLWVLELFDMYATDGHTNGRTDEQKQRLLPLSYGRGHNNGQIFV